MLATLPVWIHRLSSGLAPIHPKLPSHHEEHVPIGLLYRNLNGQKDVSKDDKIKPIHVECPSHKVGMVKRFLRLCNYQKRYLSGSKFRVMSEFWPYMSDENKERYRYKADKHKYFLGKTQSCLNSQILSLDTKIPDTSLTLRRVIPNIRDKTNSRRIFDSIYILTFRPDKKHLHISTESSLPNSKYVPRHHP